MNTIPDWLYIAGAFLALLGVFFFCSVVLTKAYWLIVRLIGLYDEKIDLKDENFLRYVREQKERMDTERNGGSGHADLTGMTNDSKKIKRNPL